jgi:hypothetical protein
MKIKLGKSQWEQVGKKAGWMKKTADDLKNEWLKGIEKGKSELVGLKTVFYEARMFHPYNVQHDISNLNESGRFSTSANLIYEGNDLSKVKEKAEKYCQDLLVKWQEKNPETQIQQIRDMVIIAVKTTQVISL